MRRIWIALSVWALSVAPAPAFAWKLDCHVDKMTDKTICSLGETKWGASPKTFFILVHYDNRSGLLAVGSGRFGAQGRIRIDSNPALVTSECVREACLLSKAQTASALMQMRNGTKLIADFLSGAGGSVGPLEFPLSGFDALYQQMDSQVKK